MNQPTSFNPATFLDATLNEPTVKRPPLPVENPAAESGLYTAIIKGEPKMRAWTGKTDPTKSGYAVDIALEVQVPPQLQDSLKLGPTLIFNDSLLLDLTPTGDLDTAPGKNRRIRIYREALDLNKPGDTFSFRKMAGSVVSVKLKHELYEGELYDRIDTVLR